MNKQELLQKYIDGELPDADRKALESMIEADPETKALLEDVQTKRNEVFNALEPLNPDRIPAHDLSFQLKRKRKFYQNWKLVAGLLILIGVTAILWSIFDSNGKSGKEQNPAVVAIITNSCTEIDYYISPNRCWNRRELVLNFQKIK